VTAPVFFTELGAALRGGTVVALTGQEAHHGAEAFRLRLGEVIDVVNGAGLRATGTVVVVQTGLVEVVVDQVVAENPPLRPITLVQALAKHKRDEQAVSQAVELGIDRIIPWQAERSVVRWPAAKAEAGRERWAALVLAAAKVARRAYLPPVEPLATTDQLLSRLAWSAPSGKAGIDPGGANNDLAEGPGQAVVVLHESASLSLPDWYANWAESEKPGAGIVLLVGPEGGITETEVTAFRSELGAAVVGLGPNVLRSSTAGPAALAALSALLGRW